MSSTYFSLHAHIVFATKDRAPMISEEWRESFHAYIAGAFRGQGVTVQIVGGVADNVHALVSLKSTQSVADVMREVKKSTSLWGAERYHRFAWQRGYAAFSISAAERPRIAAYITNQEEHHRIRTSADELRELLVEHGIEYDPQYFE